MNKLCITLLAAALPFAGLAQTDSAATSKSTPQCNTKLTYIVHEGAVEPCACPAGSQHTLTPQQLESGKTVGVMRCISGSESGAPKKE